METDEEITRRNRPVAVQTVVAAVHRAWEYRVVYNDPELPLTELSAEHAMNLSGRDGWECFDITARHLWFKRLRVEPDGDEQ